MEKVKPRDVPFVEESSTKEFKEQDLFGYAGIKIKNSANVCFLKRYNIDDKENYWAECKMIKGLVKELRILSNKQLLDILNADKENYILVK